MALFRKPLHRSQARLAMLASLAWWAITLASAPAFADTRAASGAGVPALPPGAQTLVPAARLQGQGALTWLGLSIYHSYLWAPGRAAFPVQPLALDLHYARAIAGGKIAERSVDEMRGLGVASDETLARWGEAMRRLFPDVGRGDHLTGVHLPGRGAHFFHNGRPVGEIPDPAFSEAFFGIWLHPKTSQPALRLKLLGD